MRTYRAYVPGDDDAAVLKLRANVWGAAHAHTNQAFLRWLYADCPAGCGAGIVVFEGDEAQGFAGLLARRAVIGGATVPIAQCVDFMMHRDARGGASAFRIMSSWAKLARELGFRFGIGFPNTSSYELVTRPKLGWIDAFRPDHMIRPLSADGAPQGLIPHLPASVMRGATITMVTLCTARAAFMHAARPPGSAVCIDRFDARFDRLWQHSSNGHYAGIQRDAAYLNWRYLEHPVYSYQRVGWEVDGKLVGYVVATLRELFNVSSLLLVDLLVEPTAPEGVVEALIAHLTRREQATRSPMVHALALPGSPMRAALSRAGFMNIPRRFDPKPFVMTAHDLVAECPRNGGWTDWNFHWGDMDVV